MGVIQLGEIMAAGRGGETIKKYGDKVDDGFAVKKKKKREREV